MEKKFLRNTGLTQKDLKEHESIDNLLKTCPAMVCAKIMSNASLALNGGAVLKLHKDQVIILPLGLYKQMEDGVGMNKINVKLHKYPFRNYFKRYHGQNLNGKKLLIWRTGGIGDLIFIQPLLKRLKSLYPTCKITFCTANRNTPILKTFPKGLVDYIGSLPFSLDILKNHDYHLTFEGAIERCQESHTLDCYKIFQKMAGVDFDVEDYIPELIPNNDIIEEYKGKIPEKVVMIQPRASSIIRTLSFKKLIELATKVSEAGFVAGIQDSFENSNNLQGFIDKNLSNVNVFNLANLSKTISHGVVNAYYCVGSISTDSAFTHINAALNKPVVGLYGPFKGELRMKYYKTGDWVNLSDSGWNECKRCPCFIHENNMLKCPYISSKNDPKCMDSLDIDTAIEKFLKLYNNGG